MTAREHARLVTHRDAQVREVFRVQRATGQLAPRDGALSRSAAMVVVVIVDERATQCREALLERRERLARLLLDSRRGCRARCSGRRPRRGSCREIPPRPVGAIRRPVRPRGSPHS